MVDDFVFWHNLVRARFDNRPDLEILGAAYSGLEAVQKAADLQLDLVLLVINLPDKNGRAAEQFRQRVPKSKTIFVTIESEH